MLLAVTTNITFPTPSPSFPSLPPSFLSPPTLLLLPSCPTSLSFPYLFSTLLPHLPPASCNFYINSTTGESETTIVLNRELVGQFSLVATAVDGDTDPGVKPLLSLSQVSHHSSVGYSICSVPVTIYLFPLSLIFLPSLPPASSPSLLHLPDGLR